MLSPELARIIELRRRGWGYARIAREVYGDPRKRYKVYRLLRRFEEGRITGSSPCCKDAPMKVQHELQHENEDRGTPTKTIPRRDSHLTRLGKTQKLVLEALAILGPSTPSEIARYIWYEYGVLYTRNSVWAALQRLRQRGVVFRDQKGRYLARKPGTPIYVENLRINGRIIWSTKEMGRPAVLEEALILASLYTSGYPVDQVELMILGDKRLNRWAEYMRRRMGWSMTVIYYNESLRSVKIEHRFHAPPLIAKLQERDTWLEYVHQPTLLAGSLVEHSLSILGGA